MVDMLPEGSNWAAFGIGAMQMPMVAQAILLGGNVRVGLEDNIWYDKNKKIKASNIMLLKRIHQLIEINQKELTRFMLVKMES